MATTSAASLASLESLEQPKQELVVFRNSHESSSMYTPKGTRVIFVAGKYATQDPEIIAFLDDTIAAGSQFLRRGTPEDVAGITGNDPLAQLRAKFFAEFAADSARITAELNQGKDQGTSNQGPLKAATTKDIAPISAGR